MKRVLIFSVAYFPWIGGAEVVLRETTDCLFGMEFDMVTLNLDGKQEKKEKIGNVNIYRIGGKGRVWKLFFPFMAFIKASYLHHIKSYDATWSIMASFSGFAALFFKWTHRGTPFILSLHEGDPIPEIKRKVRFVYPLFKSIFHNADIIHAISKYIVGFVSGLKIKNPVVVIPNGINIGAFDKTKSSASVENLKRDLGKKDGDIFLITTSRLVVKNGVEDVIRSLAYLPDHVKFIIVGVGVLEPSLKKLTNDLGLDSRVMFLGEKKRKDIPDYLAVSDIFIRPSLSENFSISFLEAMASRLPIIATPVGGTTDFIKDGETGLLCNVKDPRSITEKVQIYLNNPDIRDRIARQAYELVKTKYDMKVVVQDMRTKIFDVAFSLTPGRAL
jgi:glycosyltransferase involved in cell wall biosynthesis